MNGRLINMAPLLGQKAIAGWCPPTYVETDENHVITKIVPSWVAKVMKVQDADNGDLRVVFTHSCAVHIVKADNPKFQEISNKLTGAMMLDREVVIAEEDMVIVDLTSPILKQN